MITRQFPRWNIDIVIALIFCYCENIPILILKPVFARLNIKQVFSSEFQEGKCYGDVWMPCKRTRIFIITLNLRISKDSRRT